MSDKMIKPNEKKSKTSINMSDFYPPQISDIEKLTLTDCFIYKNLGGMIGFEPMDPHNKIVWALNNIIHKAMYDINTCSNYLVTYFRGCYDI